MKISPLLLTLCLVAIPGVHAQTTVFNDTFGNGSTINSNPTSPASPTLNKTAYQQLSAKTFSPNPPTIASGSLRYGSVATSSGFNSIEALFTQYPVSLANVNDYIELTVVFTDEANLMNAANATLFFGLHDSGQVQPVPGGMNSTIATATAGYAQNWQGYVSRILYSGGTHSISTRAAQLSTAANNQDVLYNYSGVANVGSSATPAVSAFTAGQQYTEVLRITKASASTLTIVSSLYQGADTGGTQIFTETATSSSILTSTFDALGIGYRPVSGASIMNVNAIKIVTNASVTIAPVITTQPSPASQTVTLGSPVGYSVAANGGGAATVTYQWQKSIDGGTIYTDIVGETGTTYSIAATTLADSAKYRVIATDVAGSTTSNVVTLSVTAGSFAPAITSQPSPSSSTVNTGASASFTVQVSGNPQPSVQWQKSTDGGATYSNVGTATTDSPNTYTLASAALADTGLYRVVATNTEGSATSDAASLTVQKGVAISAQPVGAVVGSGSPYTLSVTVNADATPAPSYVWQKTIDGLNFTTVQSGSTASLALTGSTSASGFYRVTVSNAVNSVTSSLVYAGVASTVLGTPTVSPANNASAVNRDAPLVLTFSGAPVVGSTGAVRVYDASNDSLVATVDLAQMVTSSLVYTNAVSYGVFHFTPRTIQGESYYYTPIISLGTQPAIQSRGPLTAPSVNTHTAMVFLPTSTTLNYGKTYYVKIDAGVFIDSTGATFPGISDTTTWRFTTKSAGPASGATSITVANDGSTSDFSTVQGACDFVPNSNTTPRTVTIRNGVYYEQVYLKSPYVTLQGESQNGTIIDWLANNYVINAPGSPSVNLAYRNVLRVAATDTALRNLTIYNPTPQGGSQAEALMLNSQRILVDSVSLFSYQDTYLGTGTEFFYNCYIEGDVDFLWGGGASFFKSCTINMARQSGGIYAQVRNPSSNHGFVFLDCAFTAMAGTNNSHYLNRIDPASFPYCEMVLLNCSIGSTILNSTTAVSGTDYNVGWWKMMNTTAATALPNIRLWDYNTKDQNGNTMDFSPRASYTKKMTSPADDTDIANYSNVSWVLNSWSPTVSPVIQTQPAGSSVALGAGATFTVAATGFPNVTYQWNKNGSPISGATGSSYTLLSTVGSDWASYTVTVTNSAGSVTSSAATLTFSDPQTNYVASHGLDPATTGASSADPDADGLVNKLEFFLGGDPTTADSGILPVGSYLAAESGGPALVFEFDRNTAAAGVSYTVEYSTDLTSWTTAVHGANGVTVVTTPVDANIDHITATIPSTGTKVFARLRL